MAQDVLQSTAEGVPEQLNTFRMDTTLRRMKECMCEWFLHAMQNLKHRLDLHGKAWRHLRVSELAEPTVDGTSTDATSACRGEN